MDTVHCFIRIPMVYLAVRVFAVGTAWHEIPHDISLGDGVVGLVAAACRPLFPFPALSLSGWAALTGTTS